MLTPSLSPSLSFYLQVSLTVNGTAMCVLGAGIKQRSLPATVAIIRLVGSMLISRSQQLGAGGTFHLIVDRSEQV